MNLAEATSWAQRHVPVFIVGAPRSGTTVLYRRLMQHSRFAPIQENLAETDIVAQLSALAYYQPGRPKRMWQYMMGDEERFRQFIDSVQHLTPWTERFRRAENWVEERLDRQWRWPSWASPYHVIVRSYFYHAWMARGADRLLEKTPHHVGDVGLFRRAFPEAVFIYIHRHPIDVYSSYRRRIEVEPKAASWADLAPEEFADLYRERHRTARRWNRRIPAHFRLVSYARLTREPEDEFARLLDFLGEPYERRVAVEVDPDLTKWERSPHLYGQLTPTTKRWRDHVSEPRARRVEELLDPLMRTWDYPRYT